jgi:hypothetical protein
LIKEEAQKRSRSQRENELFAKINENAFPHALILEGAEENERLEFAVLLAAALCCEGKTRPCLTCSSCRKARLNIHPDIRHISSEKPLGVDLVRESLIHDMNLKPSESERKIYLIDLSNGMTVQAQNALLKSLEEPPKNVYIMLLCMDKLCLIETVRSRCAAFGLKDSEGSENSKKSTLAGGFVKSLVSNNPLDSFGYATDLPRAAKGELQAVLDALAEIFSGALRIRISNCEGCEAARMLSGFRAQSLASCATLVNDYRNMLPQNLNPDTVVSGLAVDLWEELH